MNPEKIETPIFDPRDPAYRWRLWKKFDSHAGGFYHVYWRRIGAVLAILFLAGWFAATAGLWAGVKYGRGFSEARYLDLAVPWRWTRYRAAMARHYLTLGRGQLERGYPTSALNYLNASLALEPGGRESVRLAALAQRQLGFKAAALALLRAQLAPAAAAGDEAFLRTFFDVAFDLQADDVAFASGRRLLPPQPDRLRIHQLVALEVATARYNRGHYLEAEQILAEWRLQDFPEGEVLYARCDAERGWPAKAESRLEGDLARFTNRDGIYAALEILDREEGLPLAVHRYALLRGFAAPTRPQMRIDLPYADHALGRDADVRREVDSYCADFGSDPDALVMLSQFAADTGAPDTAARARDLAAARGIPTANFDLRAAQACIVAGDYRGAIRAVAAVQSGRPSLGPGYETLLAGIGTVARFGARDSGAELAFSDFLPRAGALNAMAGLFLAEQLRRAGFPRQSRQLLERVCANHPDDPPALAALIRSDATAGDRTDLLANLPGLLKMRKPPRDVLEASLPWLDPAADATLRVRVAAALADSPAVPLPPGG